MPSGASASVLESLWRRRPLLAPFLLSGALVALSFVLQGKLWIFLEDGGFLWYGTQRTVLGEIPLRDFQAYDPGRYYWAAAWSHLLGDGMVALRASFAILHALALSLALLAARSAGVGWPSTALFACTSTLWMFPWFKTVEASLPLVGIFFASWLVSRPSPSRHFVSGVFVGLAAFFGRNLGAYHLVAFLLLSLYVHHKVGWQGLTARLRAGAFGVVLGYSPMLLLAFAPGFLDSFVDSLRLTFATDLSVPIPWPWAKESWPLIPAGYAELSLPARWPWIYYGLTWLLLPGFCALGILVALTTRPADVERRALLFACAFVGLPLIHYAFSRADPFHMAPSLHPMLLGVAALPAALWRERSAWVRMLPAIFLILSFAAGLRFNMYSSVKGMGGSRAVVEIQVREDALVIDQISARLIGAVERAHSRYVRPDESMLILPFVPGLYAILGVRSPIWEISALIRPTDRVRAQMIPSLEANAVNWVLLADISIDDREDLKLRSTHPEFWRYFQERFEPLPENVVPAPYRLYRRTERLRSKPL